MNRADFKSELNKMHYNCREVESCQVCSYQRECRIIHGDISFLPSAIVWTNANINMIVNKYYKDEPC